MRRPVRFVLLLAGFAALGFAAVWCMARPAAPDAFCEAAEAGSGPPGTLIAAEPLPRPVPLGTRGWRSLYATTRHDGRPAVASAVVVAPAGPGPHPVIAHARSTTGIARGPGTAGGHASLVGGEAARAVLDGRTAVWGHWQGGRPAL